MTKNRFRLFTGAMLGCALILASCSKPPTPVRPGSPAFFWAAANTAWFAGDYPKTCDSLNQLLANENEYVARARVWQLVAAPGLVRGYMDLADGYEKGSRYNRTDVAAFRGQMRTARAAAAQLSLLAGETFRAFLDNDKSSNIVFAFPYPAAGVEQPAQAAKLAKGILLKAAEAEGFQTAMLQGGVQVTASRLAAADVFSKGISREQFLTATAFSLYEQANLFGPKQLDQPQRLYALYTLADEALRVVPPTAKTKEVQAKIKRTLSKRRPT